MSFCNFKFPSSSTSHPCTKSKQIPPPPLSVLSPCSPSHQSSLPKECQFGSANNAGNYGCMLDCKWACCHCRILARISTRHAVQHHLRPSIIGSALNCFFFFPFHHYYSYPKEKPESLSIFCPVLVPKAAVYHEFFQQS